jgi:hypothetical protein
LQPFHSNSTPPAITPNAAPRSGLILLTRKEFYQLAQDCRAYATELAQHEQTRVNLAQCHKFNAWLPQLQAYDRLEPFLRTMKPARPITRWQLLTLAIILGLILLGLLSGRLVRFWQMNFFYTYLAALLIFYWTPEGLYGTTVELIEGKVLRVVDALDRLLQEGELGLTEAAYFQVKENLEAARRELRQQIDLAHR